LQAHRKSPSRRTRRPVQSRVSTDSGQRCVLPGPACPLARQQPRQAVRGTPLPWNGLPRSHPSTAQAASRRNTATDSNRCSIAPQRVFPAPAGDRGAAESPRSARWQTPDLSCLTHSRSALEMTTATRHRQLSAGSRAARLDVAVTSADVTTALQRHACRGWPVGFVIGRHRSSTDPPVERSLPRAGSAAAGVMAAMEENSSPGAS